MILSKLAVLSGGVLTVLMTIFHIAFPWIFGWKREFSRISDTTRRIFLTIHAALYLLFAALAILVFVHASDFINPGGMAVTLLLLLFLFWLWRAVWQLVYFKPKKGSGRVYMHIVLTIVFFLMSACWLLPLVL